MTRLSILRKEAEILHELLEEVLSDIRMEIADTDSQPYREKLKERKAVVQSLLIRLDVADDRPHSPRSVKREPVSI